MELVMKKSGSPLGDADRSHSRDSNRAEDIGEDEKSSWEEGDFNLCVVDGFYRNACIIYWWVQIFKLFLYKQINMQKASWHWWLKRNKKKKKKRNP